MPVVEISHINELKFILERRTKVVILFYVDWISDCNKFKQYYIEKSLETKYYSISFCQINIDLSLDLRDLFNIDTRSTPITLFLHNNKIIEKLEGNHHELYDVYLFNFLYYKKK